MPDLPDAPQLILGLLIAAAIFFGAIGLFFRRPLDLQAGGGAEDDDLVVAFRRAEETEDPLRDAD